MNSPSLENSYAGARVLITGGLGFIGSNLARRLVDLDAEVTLLDSLDPAYGGNPYNIHGFQECVQSTIGDIRDEAVITRLVQNQDFAFNLAGQVSHRESMQSPFLDLDINARGQLVFLEACRRHNPKIKIVYAGTRQVYGCPQYLPVDENHPLNPSDIHAVNKLAGEFYHALYHRVYGVRSAALRMTNVYGPRMRIKDDRKTFLGWWIHQLLADEDITVFGDGRQVRDLLYIEDAVDALLLAGSQTQAEGQSYNLGGSEPIGLEDLARKMIAIHRSGRFRIVPFPADLKPIDIGDYVSDCTKIRTQLGWQPSIHLDEGLTLTLEFYHRNKKHYW
jgi:UDP-glucose 4-epimerase